MFTTRPELLGTFGVAASTHWLATATAMAALEEGGNAFDAAVAAGFALQVVEPHLNGPGGDMPALIWSAGEERLRVVCGQGPAPAAATIDAFRTLGLDIVPGTGLLACCVPGAVDAWLSIARDYGTMDLARLLRPAIEFAAAGYPLVGHAVATIASVESPVPRGMAELCRCLSAGWPAAGGWDALPQSCACPDLDAPCRRSRRRVTGRPDRRRPAYLSGRLHCRNDR